MSEALSVIRFEHLIPVISLVVRGGTTGRDGPEHCAGAILLRRQMLYPLSYEHWEIAVTCGFTELHLVPLPGTASDEAADWSDWRVSVSGR